MRAMVEAGASIHAIGRELGLTRHATRRALADAGLRTRRAETLATARAAREAGAPRLVRTCLRHGPASFAPDVRGTYRCTRCSMDAVSRRRRKMKATLVAEA